MNPIQSISVRCFGPFLALPAKAGTPTQPAKAGTPTVWLWATCTLLLVGFCGCDQAPPGAAQAASATWQPAELPSRTDLKSMVDRAIAGAVARRMNPEVQSAWQIVHGLLAFGPELELQVAGQPVGALDYLFSGQPAKGWNLVPGPKGLEAPLEAGSKTGQGHEDQWIGYLSQCGVTPDTTLVVRGETFQVADLVAQAQWDIHDGMEATWTLMAFATWLPLDAKWPARDGTTWTIERIAALEAGQPLGSGGCGGSHRLFALALAANRFEAEQGELSGGWQAARGRVDAAVERVREYQQADGSFSINYFERRGTTPEIQTRLSTTGHTLEFLTVALTDEELAQPWVTRAVVHLCELLDVTQEFDLECGGLYHAAHGLALYRQRRLAPQE